MKVDEFVELVDQAGNDEKVQEIVMEHIKDVYVPYEEKVNRAQQIVDMSCLWDVGDETMVKVNSPTMNMLTALSIINVYTDIEIGREDGDALRGFNLLNSRGIINMIIALMNQDEFKEYDKIIQMCYNDLMTNEYGIHAFVDKQMKQLKLLFSPAMPAITQMLEQFAGMLQAEMNTDVK